LWLLYGWVMRSRTVSVVAATFGRRRRGTRDHGVASGVGVVDEEAAVGGVLRVKGETEQSLFAA